MPSARHEAIVATLKEAPRLLLEHCPQLRCTSAPTVLSDADLVGVAPTGMRVDLVVRVGTRSPAAVLLGEVQLRRDDRKQWTWPLYATALRHAWRCPALLAVVSVTSGTARWAASPISIDGGRSCLYVTAIGPEEIPLVTDLDEASGDVARAVLSALVHGHKRAGVRAALAAIEAAARLDVVTSATYYDRVWSGLNKRTGLPWRN